MNRWGAKRGVDFEVWSAKPVGLLWIYVTDHLQA